MIRQFSDHVIRAGELPYRTMLLLRAVCSMDDLSHDESWIPQWIAVINCERDRISLENERRTLSLVIEICEVVRGRAEAGLKGVERVREVDGEHDDMQIRLVKQVWRDALEIYVSVKQLAMDEIKSLDQ